MDGSLSSSRNSYDNNNNRSYYQHNNYHRRDYNNNNRRGRGYNNRRGRGGGYNNNRYQPYRRGGRGGGGGRGHRQPGNRFDNNAETRSVDPQQAMLKQLTAMVAKMGDLIQCAESARKNAGEDASSSSGFGNTGTEEGPMSGMDANTKRTRAVVKAVARNIQDLVGVLCSSQNAPMFLKFTPRPPPPPPANPMDDGLENTAGTGNGVPQPPEGKIKMDEEAGPLATLITSCAAALPLQSPSYAGLTLGVEEHAPDLIDGNVTSYKGFAQRCITMACQRLASDLDSTCGVTFLLDSGIASSSSLVVQDNEGSSSSDSFVDAFMRCKLLLRYFALLARAGIVAGYDETKDMADCDVEEGTSSSLGGQTVAGVLKLFMVAAIKASDASLSDNTSKAACDSFKNTAILMCALILSTAPYAVHFIPQSFMDFIMAKVEGVLATITYKSMYQPGVGMMAILLDKEIYEESFAKDQGGDNSDDDDDDDDEEEEDDDDDDSSPPCADTFQDLLRTVRKVLDSFYNTSTVATRYSLLTDAPWLCLKGKEQEYAPMEGDEEDAMLKQKKEAMKLEYTGDQIFVSLQSSVLLSYLFSLDGSSNTNDILTDGVSLSTTVALQCPSLEGIIFGRISVFDPPPDEDEEDDDEEQPENPNVGAYVKNFSLTDRFFLSEAVRDCLVCHKSNVSPSGLEKGTCKDVAEQIWGVCHLFEPVNDEKDNMDDDDKDNNLSQPASTPKGVEYGIVETILSLIIQSPRNIDSSSPLSHIYLSRVLIELTKYQPSLVPQCLVVAVAALFNDFLPSLSPLAIDNMSRWLAFHLTNTDYQWPQAYWNVWTPYVIKGLAMSSENENIQKRNCRGEFVVHTIQYMASNLSCPELLVKECLPEGSELSNYIIGKSRHYNHMKSAVLEDIQKDLTERIWNQFDDPEVIREYIIGDEISETVQNDLDDGDGNTNPDFTWWRTGLVVKSLLRPALRDRQRLESLIKDNQYNEIDVDFDMKEDVLTDIGNIIPKYKPVILATIAQDIRVHEENLDLRGESKKSESDMILSGETFVLHQCELVLSYSTVILKSCIDLFVNHEIVSPKAVVSWSIEGFGKETEVPNPVSSGWWDYASSAARLGVDKSLSNDGTNADMLSSDIGMIIDTGGDEDDNADSATPSIRRMKGAVEYVLPIIRYTSSRVNRLLESNNSSTKLSHGYVDLKEGLKHFTRSLSSHLKATLKQDPIVKATTELGGAALEVETFMANSEL